jgi:sigma-54 dependent transcriptional regulator, acetoin dehydrogenase operon transcriptional activator AcoR
MISGGPARWHALKPDENSAYTNGVADRHPRSSSPFEHVEERHMPYTWNETRDETTRRTFLDKAWQSFLGDGVELEGLSADIIRSWRRARDTFGIDPGQRRCMRLLSTSDLALRREGDDAYALAKPILDEFGARLAASNHVLTFFDAAGWMLAIGGSKATAEELGDINFCPGANWREEAAGTNGPGTALAERHAVEVFASEHFVEAWQSWNCAAAPVFSPTGLMGVVDVTGPWTAHDVQGLVIARAIARAIEERLRSAQAVRDQVIEYAFRTAPQAEGLFAIDARGRVLAANDLARRRLAMQGEEVPQPVRDVIGVTLRPGASVSDGELLVEWPGGIGKVRLFSAPVRFDGRAVGAVVRVLASASAARAKAPARGAAPAAGSVTRYDFGSILGESRAIAAAIALTRAAARNDLPVVLSGESGTGKELFAQAIHCASARSDGPFIAVNCGCIPAALLEAELFGYEAGTFTGGRKEGNAGKFEEACGGTLFLDEVSELSLQAQTALLRVLQEREVVRLGGSAPRRVDLRVVAATNKPLAEEIRAGRFRADLYYRLNVLAVSVPPLRERPGDVAYLARAFLKDAEAHVGRRDLSLSDAALRALEGYAWPGNVRELRNVMLRVAATSPGDVVSVLDLPPEVCAGTAAPPPCAAPVPAAPDVAAAEVAPAGATADPDREALVRALEGASWNVARTAQSLRVSRMTLYRWLRKHNIER